MNLEAVDYYDVLRSIIHYGLHFVAPLLLAGVFFKKNWKLAYVLMIATMLVDLDHLLADPIFDPNRCSVGFHPLHSYYAIAAYVVMLLIPNWKVRAVAVGLLFHMLTDFQDCLWIK